MIHGKTCSNCGSNLDFDRNRKILVCPFCGKTKLLEDTDEPVTLAAIDAAIKDGLYGRAAKMIEELKKTEPDDPRLTVRSLRCALLSPTIADALHNARKDSGEIKKFLDLSEWTLLSSQLSEKDKTFIGRVKEYCSVSTDLINKNEEITRRRQPIRQEEKRTWQSKEEKEKEREQARLSAEASAAQADSEMSLKQWLYFVLFGVYLIGAVVIHEYEDISAAFHVLWIVCCGGLLFALHKWDYDSESSTRRSSLDRTRQMIDKLSSDQEQLQKKQEELLTEIRKKEGSIAEAGQE